ncbi:MAG: sugar phosphate isomerase/epimerase [Parasphingorhabdus sp.]|uniref:sugar phosphate isomerase/epimerase family protein n=1 Tax=Parasphingorhabdus sp. TaxID=2709688 RepID=UPI0032987E92
MLRSEPAIANKYKPRFRFCALLLLSSLLIQCSPIPTVERSRDLFVDEPLVIGAQLYTVRDAMTNNIDGTLTKISNMGYQTVEFAGLFGEDPKRVGQLVRSLDMQVIGSHIDAHDLRLRPEKVIAETKALGARYMVLAWIPAEERQNLEQWEDWIKIINHVAEKAHAQGIGFAYHNHEFEFTPISDSSRSIEPFELLFAKLNPRYVDFELDIYWTRFAGKQPEAYFERFPGRFSMVHIKDMSRTNKDIVDVGNGRIKIPEIVAQAQKAGVRHFVIEHDNPKNPFETLQRSLTYLQSINPRSSQRGRQRHGET